MNDLISYALCLFLFLVGWGFIPMALAGEATLGWDPPTTHEDGTPLTDLAGYRVYHGLSSGVYDAPVEVGNVITYSTFLDEGITYFTVTAYNTSGNESGHSNEVSKAILGTPPGNVDLSTPASATRVDGYDLIALELALGATPSDSRWNPMADLDSDGVVAVVDGLDLNVVIRNFGVIKNK